MVATQLRGKSGGSDPIVAGLQCARRHQPATVDWSSTDPIPLSRTSLCPGSCRPCQPSSAATRGGNMILCDENIEINYKIELKHRENLYEIEFRVRHQLQNVTSHPPHLQQAKSALRS